MHATTRWKLREHTLKPFLRLLLKGQLVHPGVWLNAVLPELVGGEGDAKFINHRRRTKGPLVPFTPGPSCKGTQNVCRHNPPGKTYKPTANSVDQFAVTLHKSNQPGRR